MTTQDPSKQLAAAEALKLVRSGMCIGLGTGSTATIFIELLGHAVKSGDLSDIRGVPTSVQSDQLARSLGIELVNFSNVFKCDLTIDGADEVSPRLELIKGLGGALLREKIVAQNSDRLVIIADASKRVLKLGTRSPLPVEVVRFALAAHERFLKNLGSEPNLRRAPDGLPFITDNGNYIFDCRFPRGIDDAPRLAHELGDHAGIVEHGLFLGLAKLALIADEDHVETMAAP